jgi:hypothetical protein
MIEQHVYVYPRENEVAFHCEFRNLKRPKSETTAEYEHSLRILQKACISSLRYSDIEATVIDPYIHRLSKHELKSMSNFTNLKP